MSNNSKRRAPGDGSIYQRKHDGRWVASLVVGSRPDGHPDKRVRYARTRGEARRKLDELRRLHALGLTAPAQRLTVAEFLGQWLQAGSAGGAWRPSTVRVYEKMVRLYVVPRLGKTALAELRPTDLTALYATLLERGRVSRRRQPGASSGLSAGQVRMVHRMLLTALRQGERWGALAKNVAAAVDAPVVSTREFRALSPREARQLVERADATGDRLSALWYVLLDTGARIGEALALTWARVSLGDGVVTVTRAIANTRAGPPAFGETKTARGRRRLTLTGPARRALLRHRQRQEEERRLAGGQWNDHDLVFATATGLALGQSWVRDLFKRALARAGLPETVRLHDLRHTNATLLMAAGVNPRVVGDRLGHTRVSVTLDTYSHVTPSVEAEAAARLSDILYGKAETAPGGQEHVDEAGLPGAPEGQQDRGASHVEEA